MFDFKITLFHIQLIIFSILMKRTINVHLCRLQRNSGFLFKISQYKRMKEIRFQKVVQIELNKMVRAYDIPTE